MIRTEVCLVANPARYHSATTPHNDYLRFVVIVVVVAILVHSVYISFANSNFSDLKKNDDCKIIPNLVIILGKPRLTNAQMPMEQVAAAH